MQKKRLPPKVHEKGGRYYFVDKNKWHGLSYVNEGTPELHRRLAGLTSENPNTLTAIFTKFVDTGMTELAPTTRKQYTYFLFGILNDTFGHLMPGEIDTSTVAQYLQRRKKAGAGPCGNRERAALSSAYEFALREGLAKNNPCRGVRRNREKASTVFIESEDMSATIDRAPDHFARVMQLAYLTGMRAVDLRLLKVQDVTPQGLWYTESKTGKRVVMEWTHTLRELVREILEARQERINRPYANKYKKERAKQTHDFLLTNRLGNPLGEWGIISNMRRLQTKGWSFRAIRPKAQTDAGDGRNVLGHMGQMRERYTRRRKLVPVR